MAEAGDERGVLGLVGEAAVTELLWQTMAAAVDLKLSQRRHQIEQLKCVIKREE